MRLPWIQVEKAGIAQCRLLARLLGIPEAQGLGMGLMLWEWALEIAEDDDFTGSVPDAELLAAALMWPVADAPRLVIELQRVGMVATTPSLRVRGLERYRTAWEKNQRRNGKPAKSGDGVPATGDNPPGLAPKPRGTSRKTETETETETEKRGSMSSPLQALRADGAGEDKKPRWERSASDFITWAKTLDPGLGNPGPKVRDWAREFFQKFDPADPELPRAAFAKFLLWCHQSGKQVGWGLWLAESVWEPRWAEVRAESMARGAA